MTERPGGRRSELPAPSAVRRPPFTQTVRRPKALQAFQQHPAGYDVIVTDLSMPGMSGFHFARALLDVRPDVAILMTSGYVRPQDRETARELGVRDLILKPDTIEELGHSLARLFRETKRPTQ